MLYSERAKQRLANYFTLSEPFERIDRNEFLSRVSSKGATENFLYAPNTLRAPLPPQRFPIKKTTFRNASFSYILIENFEFEKCVFEDCLFISTTFRDCWFSNCIFSRCTVLRIEFDKVFINPRSFDECLNRYAHQNLGVSLYQQLFYNSRRELQLEFESYSLYNLGRWHRFQYHYDLDRATPARALQLRGLICINWLFQISMGYGVRFSHLFGLSFSLLWFFSCFNWFFSDYFCLKIVEQKQPASKFVDVLYFTIIIFTTVGFGDIVPTNTTGRFVVALEGGFGLVLFAILASMLFKKLSP